MDLKVQEEGGLGKGGLRRISGLGDWVRGRLKDTPLGKGPFSEGFVTCTLLFCTGSMAILGSVRAGLDH